MNKLDRHSYKTEGSSCITQITSLAQVQNRSMWQNEKHQSTQWFPFFSQSTPILLVREVIQFSPINDGDRKNKIIQDPWQCFTEVDNKNEWKHPSPFTAIFLKLLANFFHPPSFTWWFIFSYFLFSFVLKEKKPILWSEITGEAHAHHSFSGVRFFLVAERWKTWSGDLYYKKWKCNFDAYWMPNWKWSETPTWLLHLLK